MIIARKFTISTVARRQFQFSLNYSAQVTKRLGTGANDSIEGLAHS